MAGDRWYGYWTAAYVFIRDDTASTWSDQLNLTASLMVAGDVFGHCRLRSKLDRYRLGYWGRIPPLMIMVTAG